MNFHPQVGYCLEIGTGAELRLALAITLALTGSVMEVHHPVCILALGPGQLLLYRLGSGFGLVDKSTVYAFRYASLTIHRRRLRLVNMRQKKARADL